MKIKLTTVSSLLCSTGESSAHIDADIRFDQYGLPFIPAKTIKGLLRESAMEVCELHGFSEEKTKHILDNLFGLSGSNVMDRPVFNNLQLVNYIEIVSDLKSLGSKLSNRDVQSYFTVWRRQTSIDLDGTAKDKSLRTYRLLKMGFQFEAKIENLEQFQNQVEHEVFCRALKQLRYMGLRRNRGFGKVKLQIVAISSLSKNLKIDFDAVAAKEGLYILDFKIANLSPIQISKTIGDQNTVGSEDYIPAQNIRGLVAGLLASQLKQPLHENDVFKDLVLKGSTRYHGAFPFVNGNKTFVSPLALGYNKLIELKERNVVNMLEEPLAANKPWKNWFYLTSIADQLVYNRFSTETVYSFHASRSTEEERLAGRSIEKTGGIYYYEAIEQGQVFHSSIIGSYKNLETIQTLFLQNGGVHRLGHSKSAQYAQVQFSDFILDNIDCNQPGTSLKKDDVFYLVFESPVILYNQFGMAIADGELLEDELKRMNLELLDLRSSVCWIENYLQIWKCKTPREQAFAMGTSLKVKAMEDFEIPKTNLIYISERLNEGFGCIRCYTELPHNIKVKKAVNRLKSKQDHEEGRSNIVKDIIKMKMRNELEEKIKLDAFEFAAKAIKDHKISNHLISRLRLKLNACRNDLDRWDKFIVHLSDKPAGKALEKILGDINSIKELKYSNHENPDERILYWSYLLNMLRIKSRIPKSHHHEQSNR